MLKKLYNKYLFAFSSGILYFLLRFTQFIVSYALLKVK